MSRMLHRHRVLGLAFVLLLVGALTLSVLVYRKAFTPVAWVTVHTDHTGLQLSQGADVKMRGVRIGEVRSITANGTAATLRLALDPSTLHQIPGNVSVELLPATLFGERYVSLAEPSKPSTRSLRAGAVIGQDRSSSAIELEKVLDDTLPLLQAIQPDKLAATLGAIATALQGKGDEIGQDLTDLDRYLTAINGQLPTLQTDIKRLSTVLSTYNGSLPDLMSILKNVTVTANTISQQREQVAAFLDDATDLATTSQSFLDSYGDRIIQIGQVSAPLLELLATYSPEYPCLLQGAVKLQPDVEKVFTGGQMHITLEVTRNNGKYLSGKDAPVYGADDGPDCRGLPDPPVPAPQVRIDNGYDYGTSRAAAKLPVSLNLAPMGYAGTPEEQSLIKPLVAATTGTSPDRVPPVADLLWGPLLRGSVVNAG
ncbi:ABC transporter substrate-binding protein [Rugosimonospora africana]|uniref:ABC transporter substrate-binding protein n=2 Tax=Rugosimonospora africana TaxID=556532 RepID=A0A8J3VWT7_9ACTN|nr:ABC transporter substrate-binding protein [Rugosimonospora africana]